MVHGIAVTHEAKALSNASALASRPSFSLARQLRIKASRSDETGVGAISEGRGGGVEGGVALIPMIIDRVGGAVNGLR